MGKIGHETIMTDHYKDKIDGLGKAVKSKGAKTM